MKNKLLFFVTLFVISAFFTSNICIVNAAGQYGTVKDISNADSLWNKDDSYNVNIENNTTEKVTITYGEIKVNTLPSKEDRPEGYAWLGFHITRPTGTTSKVKVNGKEIDNYTDGDYYFGINKDKLIDAVKNKRNIEYKYEFDWDNNGDYEQTVTAIINPAKVTLTENSKTGTSLWTPEMIEEYAPLDDAPNTGDTIPYFLIGILSLIITTGAYSLRLLTRK